MAANTIRSIGNAAALSTRLTVFGPPCVASIQSMRIARTFSTATTAAPNPIQNASLSTDFAKFKEAVDKVRPTDIWRSYRRLQGNEVSQLNLEDYSKILDVLSTRAVLHNRKDEYVTRVTLELWKSLISSGRTPSAEMCGRFIQVFGRAGSLKAVQEVVDYMTRAKLPPLAWHQHRWIMHAYARGGDATTAEDMFMKQRLDQKVTLQDANLILHGYSRGRHEARLLAFFDRMVSLGLTPDILSHYHLMSFYAAANDLPKAAEYFAQIRKLTERPSIAAFNIIIKAYLDAGEVDKARGLFDEMETLGIPKDPNTLTVAARLAASQGNAQGAWSAYRDVVLNKRVPTPMMMTNLARVTGPVSGVTEIPAKLLLDLSVANVKLTGSLLRYLVQGYVRIADIASAEQVMRWAIAKLGTEKVRGTYLEVIRGYLQADDLTNALRLLQEMQAHGHALESISSTMFIEKMVNLGRTGELEVVLAPIERGEFGVVPDHFMILQERCGADHPIVKRVAAVVK
ncbi:hypothetical protein BC832DRAFT_619883 [Gaertneriomyces semiglobifer]|nr:hypothetical protein BC832DRAFT_619883 [Gaertneriomyces semiglobifer]